MTGTPLRRLGRRWNRQRRISADRRVALRSTGPTSRAMARRRDHDHSRRAGAPSQRQLRVGEELRHALAQLLRPGELRDPALHDASITVTEVRVSPDLKNATAFVMPLAGAQSDEIMAGLMRSAPFLRARLARTVELRQIPNIAFAVDTAFDTAARIAALLHMPEVERDLQPPPECDDKAG
jgi:ribosome-binding factor A